ncbi:MAG: hypothetical protein IT233_02655 [Bacteroidia bacterium]|nr:hypothetical protein [Bacteroidia bacterium]
MIIYSKENLHGLHITNAAKRWFARNWISAGILEKTQTAYPVTFYSPNVFIRIGLFLFTHFIISSAYGMFIFWFNFIDSSSWETAMASMLIFFAVLCTGTLEFGIRRLVKGRELYNSGIGEALIYSALGFLAGGLFWLLSGTSMNDEDAFLTTCFLLLPVLLAGAVRYLDLVCAAGSVICFYLIAFLILIKTGDSAKYIIPFAFMLLSAAFLLGFARIRRLQKFLFWKKVITVARLINMLVLYFSGNYFVIRESSIEFFHMSQDSEVPLYWFFWAFTFLVPLAYLFLGLARKDKVFLWSGLILIGLSVMTFRNYYSVAPPEVALSLAGFVLILLAWVGIKYFREGRKGITYVAEPDEDNFLKEHAEALIIAQTMGTTGPSADESVGPGGGDFGGGGSETKW